MCAKHWFNAATARLGLSTCPSPVSHSKTMTWCRHSDTTQRLITQHTQVLFNAGPPVRRSPSVKTRCTTTRLHLTLSIPRLHPHSQRADRGATMLTRLHAAGWCRVDFFKPADFLVIQGTTKSRVGGGGGVQAFRFEVSDSSRTP